LWASGHPRTGSVFATFANINKVEDLALSQEVYENSSHGKLHDTLVI